MTGRPTREKAYRPIRLNNFDLLWIRFKKPQNFLTSCYDNNKYIVFLLVNKVKHLNMLLMNYTDVIKTVTPLGAESTNSPLASVTMMVTDVSSLTI